MLTSIFVYFTVVSFSAIFALGARFIYYYDIDALKISYDSGLSEEEIRLNYDAMIDYFKLSDNTEFSLPTLNSSPDGITHFADTKVIFRVFQYGFIIGLVVSIILIIINKRKYIFSYLKYSSYMLFVTMGIVGAAVCIDWEDTFVIFHKLFFNNDLWLFDAQTDPVITILPDEYFMQCAILIAFIILLSAIALMLIYKKNKNKEKILLA